MHNASFRGHRETLSARPVQRHAFFSWHANVHFPNRLRLETAKNPRDILILNSRRRLLSRFASEQNALLFLTIETFSEEDFWLQGGYGSPMGWGSLATGLLFAFMATSAAVAFPLDRLLSNHHLSYQRLDGPVHGSDIKPRPSTHSGSAGHCFSRPLLHRSGWH